jgi:hypothetical protein
MTERYPETLLDDQKPFINLKEAVRKYRLVIASSTDPGSFLIK